MRLWFRWVCVAAGLLWLGIAPLQAQSRAQLGPLCTSETTPADQQIDACNKIIALKVFSGAKLATVYFWRAVGWNKKGQYERVIADTTEALRLQPGNVALYNLRGSAYFDQGEYDIAIADFGDALRLGGPDGIVYHNRGNAFRRKGDYARAITDYDAAIRLSPNEARSWQNRGESKQALGDLDGALADINQAIRLAPSLPSPLISRAVIWRAKRDFDRAVIDGTEAVRLAKTRPPDKVLTPPNSVLILAHLQRGIAYEVKGDPARARQDYADSISVAASDAGSKANQATAKVRLALLSDPRLPHTGPAVAMRSAEPRKDAAPEQATPGAPPSRVALVIGNGGYRLVKPLPNAVADAREIAGHLRRLGFEVIEGIDLDHDAMQATTRDFLRQAARTQLALMYYAGHGIQIDGRNYLVPVDQQLTSTANPLDTMIDMDSILAGLDDRLRTNILIFDACRNNPLTRRVASAEPSRSIQGESGLAAPVTPGSGAMLGAGTLIAFATAPGQVALDGEGAHSPFAAALSRHIGTPGLEVQQMLTRVRAEVVAATRSRQVPWSNSSLLGEVYLSGK
jgi:tetratricopeptide (TPR) repeat protein